jgi:xylulokinase
MTAPPRRAGSPVVLGLDLGTTEVKAGLVTLDGRLVALARAGYSLDVSGGPGWAEQDPGAWWSAVVSAVRGLHPGEAVDVVAIGVDGHGPTLAPVDARGEATRPAITFLDTRAAAEADELGRATGVRGWALGPLPAALWLERHEPEAAAATRWYLTTWEWLAYRLTGEAIAPRVPVELEPDLTLVSRATGLRTERRPEDGTMGAVVGELTETSAAALGLRAGIPVSGGTNDAFASYLGAGLLLPGDAFDPGGSAGGFGVYWHVPLDVPGAFVTPAPLEGLYSVGAAMAATGRALDWFRDSIVGGGAPGAVSTERLLEEAAATPPGADGLVFLPYLAGERSPLWDPHARGLFAGLSLGHGRGHLARAIVEASALAIRHVAAPMLAAGVQVTAMRACGGPARSPFWNQVKADVTGFQVLVPRVLETAVLGSAILGAVGVGAAPDVPTAIRSMTAIEHEIAPRTESAAVYERLYEAYVALYPATNAIVRRLPEASGPVAAASGPAARS